MDPESRRPPSSSLFSLLQNLRVEPIILIACIAGSSSNVAVQQLMQDKLCISKHSLDQEFCTDLANKDQSTEKYQILADVAFYSSLREYVTVVPRVILLLLIGSWCDRFPSCRRYVMLSSMAGLFLDSVLLLLNSRFFDWDYRLIILCNTPSSLLCNGLGMIVSSYLIATTEESNRSLKFLIMDVFGRVGIVVGFLSSAFVLASKPMFLSESGTKNHSEVFLMNTVITLLGFIWVYFRVKTISTSAILDHDEVVDDDDEEEEETRPLFAWQAVKDTAQTLTRSRPSGARRNMWLLLLVYTSTLFPMMGLSYIFYPLTELLYKWDIQTYGLTVGSFEIVTSIMLACFTLFVQRIKPRATAITMIGLVSSIMGYICIGSIKSVHGFYLNGFASALTPAAGSGIRSFLSMIIPEHEITKVFSTTQLIEAGMGFVSPALSSLILKETISTIPTIIFHIYAFLLIISLTVVAFVDISVRKESRLARMMERSDSSEPLNT